MDYLGKNIPVYPQTVRTLFNKKQIFAERNFSINKSL
jgi:hypothetical protein